jgi:hypothetical protein
MNVPFVVSALALSRMRGSGAENFRSWHVTSGNSGRLGVVTRPSLRKFGPCLPAGHLSGSIHTRGELKTMPELLRSLLGLIMLVATIGLATCQSMVRAEPPAAYSSSGSQARS